MKAAQRALARFHDVDLLDGSGCPCLDGHGLLWDGSEEGVVYGFGSDGGFGAVSGEEYQILREGEYLVADRINQGIEVAAGEVGASDGAVEDGVADEEGGEAFEVIANAAGGMAGGVDDFIILAVEFSGGGWQSAGRG